MIAFIVQAYFIFRSPWTTMLAAFLFAWAAKVTTQYSLRLLDLKARHALGRQGGGPADLFETAA